METKNKYEKPVIEVTVFEFDSSIASSGLTGVGETPALMISFSPLEGYAGFQNKLSELPEINLYLDIKLLIPLKEENWDNFIASFDTTESGYNRPIYITIA